MPSSLESLVRAGEEEWLEGWKRGPTRLRWTQIPLQVGDRAPDYELLNSQGKTVKLSSFWVGKPALILFWRHYGCGCGMDRAKRLKGEYDGYVQAGANPLIVGQGEPERALDYAKKYELPPVPILCDPEYEVYEAYGLLEGKPSQIMFDAPKEFLDRDYEAGVQLAEERRDAKRPVVDNSWLLPGEFVVDQSGVIALAYRYNYCEDFPDHRVDLAAIREARLSANSK